MGKPTSEIDKKGDHETFKVIKNKSQKLLQSRVMQGSAAQCLPGKHEVISSIPGTKKNYTE